MATTNKEDTPRTTINIWVRRHTWHSKTGVYRNLTVEAPERKIITRRARLIYYYVTAILFFVCLFKLCQFEVDFY